ncbi:MAG TPA: class I SAM-dependent methyltransferase [Terracidiphilus sp.]|nr:class I SAM-dependent methyltransferase [Terracidiphilus sp.]
MSDDGEPTTVNCSCATFAIVPNPTPRRLPGLTRASGLMTHPFDEANGVRTSGLVAGRHLKSGHTHDRHATAYYGVAPSVLHRLMQRWQKTKPSAPIRDFTFVDIGAGMGRAVLLAAEMQFLKVTGVELNSTLARIARRNLRHWRASGRVHAQAHIRCCDAAQFPLPSGPILLFLFNPFGPTVMRRFLKHVAANLAARPRPVDLLYVNNEQEGVLETQPGFVRLFHGQIARSRADAIADHAILANQPDGEYASSNYEDCSIWRWAG